MAENLKNMFSVPETQNGIWQYPLCQRNGESDVRIYLVYIARSIIKHEKFGYEVYDSVFGNRKNRTSSITVHKTIWCTFW